MPASTQLNVQARGSSRCSNNHLFSGSRPAAVEALLIWLIHLGKFLRSSTGSLSPRVRTFSSAFCQFLLADRPSQPESSWTPCSGSFATFNWTSASSRWCSSAVICLLAVGKFRLSIVLCFSAAHTCLIGCGDGVSQLGNLRAQLLAAPRRSVPARMPRQLSSDS